MTAIALKRAYQPAAKSDGRRILVERLWPRGIRKEALQLDAWLKDLAPSTDLRKWFSHDPEKWDEFRRRYFAELNASPEAWRPLLQNLSKPLTLIYSSHDQEHNNAVALREYLESKSKTVSAGAVGGTTSGRRKASAESNHTVAKPKIRAKRRLGPSARRSRRT